jgi:hypothetical protein
MDVSDTLRLALADRFAIEREPGADGMATLYLAVDLKHHRLGCRRRSLAFVVARLLSCCLKQGGYQ